MLGNNAWQYIMFGGLYDYINRHPSGEDVTKPIFSIKSPINEQHMKTDTAHRTGGVVRGTYNVFEPEEIQLFEKLLIRK